MRLQLEVFKVGNFLQIFLKFGGAASIGDAATIRNFTVILFKKVHSAYHTGASDKRLF